MEKLKEQFTQLEAIIEHASYKEKHKMIKLVNDFADRLSLEEVGILPANHQMVKVGINREHVDLCLGRTISDQEWREVRNEIWNSYKIYELCKDVILVFAEILLTQGFCDKFTKKHENSSPNP